jgi:hypothetical protein
MSVGTDKIKLIRKDSKMLKLGYEITMLDVKTYDEIMSKVVFSREEMKQVIENVREIEGVFPMVINGMFEEEN